MDIAGKVHQAAVFLQHGVCKPAPDQAVDAHLDHLGATGEAQLDADAAFAIVVTTLHGGALDPVGILQGERALGTELGQSLGATRGLVEGLGDTGNIGVHGRLSLQKLQDTVKGSKHVANWWRRFQRLCPC
ncbi:hypothetical protein D3C78_1256980 [compost metagenome]